MNPCDSYLHMMLFVIYFTTQYFSLQNNIIFHDMWKCIKVLTGKKNSVFAIMLYDSIQTSFISNKRVYVPGTTTKKWKDSGYFVINTTATVICANATSLFLLVQEKIRWVMKIFFTRKRVDWWMSRISRNVNETKKRRELISWIYKHCYANNIIMICYLSQQPVIHIKESIPVAVVTANSPTRLFR